MVERLQNAAGAGGAQALLQRRAATVDRGADRRALGGDNQRIDDIALQRHFARVVVEQEVVVAEDRFGADE
ncbi:MAG: hypothetical protein E6H77_01230 [Betaproteobacteria bacterium]|nr:MAG: hypothetical protein E6H77_01230 [Betaproteobacteria bacterium]